MHVCLHFTFDFWAHKEGLLEKETQLTRGCVHLLPGLEIKGGNSGLIAKASCRLGRVGCSLGEGSTTLPYIWVFRDACVRTFSSSEILASDLEGRTLASRDTVERFPRGRSTFAKRWFQCWATDAKQGKGRLCSNGHLMWDWKGSSRFIQGIPRLQQANSCVGP